MKTIIFDDIELTRELFGRHNSNLAYISQKTGVSIDTRGNNLSISGEEGDIIFTEKLLWQLYGLLENDFPLSKVDINSAVKALRTDLSCDIKHIFLNTIFTTEKGKAISPRNQTQKEYVEALRQNDMVFAIGPAGTGKTYLAMAMAVASFAKGEVNRIVLARPAVEAGEALGFLPGDLAEKVNPYLRPLYDALYDMLNHQKAQNFMEQGIIEIAPLAFMRGRTLNNSFIILDEAQNTSSEQMKMFLTRTGFSSKAVITGDITQIDLPQGKKSGLVEAKNLLYDIHGIRFIYFTKNDVVRHELVSKIIEAYEENEHPS